MKNSNQLRKQLLSMISVFGILRITVLFTGIAWSRFKEEDKKIMHIDTYHQRRWYVFGRLADEDNLSAEEITAEKIVAEAGGLPGVIQQTNDEKKIRFYVVNGPSKDKFNSTDFVYNIQVLATNTLKPEELAFILRYTDADGQQKAATAIPIRIKPEDPLYKSIGDGYIYKFMIERTVPVVSTEDSGDGENAPSTEESATITEEFTATLPGGGLNYHAYDLQIVGQLNAGLLEIEIAEVSISE